VVDGTATISSPSTAQTTVSLFGGDAILGARFLPKEIRILSVEFFDYQNRSKTVRAAYR